MSSDIPGPWPWPLVGNLPNIDLENSIQSVVNIGKQYGMAVDILICYLGRVKLCTYLTLHVQPRFVNSVLEARISFS